MQELIDLLTALATLSPIAIVILLVLVGATTGWSWAFWRAHYKGIYEDKANNFQLALELSKHTKEELEKVAEIKEQKIKMLENKDIYDTNEYPPLKSLILIGDGYDLLTKPRLDLEVHSVPSSLRQVFSEARYPYMYDIIALIGVVQSFAGITKNAYDRHTDYSWKKINGGIEKELFDIAEEIEKTLENINQSLHRVHRATGTVLGLIFTNQQAETRLQKEAMMYLTKIRLIERRLEQIWDHALAAYQHEEERHNKKVAENNLIHKYEALLHEIQRERHREYMDRFESNPNPPSKEPNEKP